MLNKRKTSGWVRHGALHVSRAGLFVLTLCAAEGTAHADATLRALANLTVGSCDVVLDTRGTTMPMRGVLASEFDTSQTATLIPFQLLVEGCNSTKSGHHISITTTGKTLNADSNVFNDNPLSDVGFMLKENGTASPNYWAGTKENYYGAPGTVASGSSSQSTGLLVDDPLAITLNYFVGFVTPLQGAGLVSTTPRHEKASITFNVIYQ